MKPHPFIKSAGGKTQLLPELRARIPKTWNPETDLYFELFLGGGALFWDLQPKHAILNDANDNLMELWSVLKFYANAEAFIRTLRDYEAQYREAPEEYYYGLRDDFVGGWIQNAARTLFLNKTCFNGLYRVNSKGEFNVPWGRNPAAQIVDEENLRACVRVLNSNTIYLYCECFTEQFHGAEAMYGDDWAKGALIYCDPPYVPVSKTAHFTNYTPGGFGYAKQLILAGVAAQLRDAGAHVMLSQAADESLIDQYRRLGFKCDKVQARRAINSKISKRGPVGEYIIYEG